MVTHATDVEEVRDKEMVAEHGKALSFEED